MLVFDTKEVSIDSIESKSKNASKTKLNGRHDIILKQKQKEKKERNSIFYNIHMYIYIYS